MYQTQGPTNLAELRRKSTPLLQQSMQNNYASVKQYNNRDRDDGLGLGGDMFKDNYQRFYNKIRDASQKQDRIFQ